jgi:hypothetical protein
VIDCLLSSNPQSEEFLWVVWELSALSRWSLPFFYLFLSGIKACLFEHCLNCELNLVMIYRSDCGRQALFSFGNFPEVCTKIYFDKP